VFLKQPAPIFLHTVVMAIFLHFFKKFEFAGLGVEACCRLLWLLGTLFTILYVLHTYILLGTGLGPDVTGEAARNNKSAPEILAKKS
jgi:hypothetical protein